MEGVAITMVIALLLAATAAWLVNTTHPPGAPPDAIGRVAQPLGDAFDLRLWEAPALPPYLGVPGGSLRAPPIGRFLGTAARNVGAAAWLAVQARDEFNQGFQESLREEAIDFVRHPLDGMLEPPAFDLLTPEGVALAIAQNADDLSAYVESLRALPLPEAILTFSGDAGDVAGRGFFDAVQILVRRRVIRGARREKPPPPPAPAESLPRTP